MSIDDKFDKPLNVDIGTEIKTFYSRTEVKEFYLDKVYDNLARYGGFMYVLGKDTYMITVNSNIMVVSLDKQTGLPIPLEGRVNKENEV